MRARATIKCSPLGDVVVESGAVVEAISAPTRASVVVLREEALEPADVIGQIAVLAVPIDEHTARHFALVVTAVVASELDTASHQYTLELEHPLALLGYRRDVRVFLEKTTRAVVDAVLGAAGGIGVEVTWSGTRGTGVRTSCVQYGETDLDFVSRLLEEEGIFYFAPDDERAAKLTFADAPSAFTPVAGKSEIPFSAEGAGMGIHELSVEHVVTSGAVALADYDFEKPGVDLTSRATVDESPAGEVFEYPGRFTTQSDGAALAKIRAEEIASTKVVVTGTSSRSQLRAAAWFTLTSTNEDTPTGKFLLRRVDHVFDGARYRNSFVASPFDLPYRPRRVTPRPVGDGTVVATVTGPSGQEIHTDRFGRMKGLFAFDRLGKSDDTSSQWIRVAQPALAGSMMLARVGWEMAVRHLDGDPDRAVAVSRMYDGEHVPPEKLPDTQTKTSFETLTSPRGEKLNAVTIEDKSGSMLMEVRAAKDLDATILHDETESIGEDDRIEIGKDSTSLIGDAQTFTVEKDEKTTAAKDAGVSVAGDRTKSISKDESATVDGGVSVRVDGNDESTIAQNLEIKATKELLETAEGKYDLTVGGAVTTKAKKDYFVYVTGNSTETVGGAKSVASSDGTLSDATAGKATLTVGGAWVETITGNRIASTQGDAERTVAAVSAITAAGKLQIKAKTIKITVSGAVTLLGGGGIVNMSPASVTLVGMVTLKGSGGVEIAGAPQMAG